MLELPDRTGTCRTRVEMVWIHSGLKL